MLKPLLKIYFWAAMHSPDFPRCRVNLPQIHWRFRRQSYPPRSFCLEIGFNPPYIYVPYSVEAAYAQSNPQAYPDFDDLPF